VGESLLAFLSRPIAEAVDITRHSRRVRRLKILLPTAAVLLATALILWPALKPSQIPAEKRETSTVEMTEARFSGFDGRGRAYTITSSHMEKMGEETVHLAYPMADISLSGNNWLALRANSALLDDTARRMDMTDRVVVFHSGGYTLDTQTLAFDMESGDIWSHDATTGQGPRGLVRGTGFRLDAASGDLVFAGPAFLSISPAPSQEMP